MKKLLKILLVIVLLIVAALIAIPFIYKNELKNMVVEEANNNLNARFEMQDFSLSLLKNFPNITATLEGVSLTGIDDFEGVKLVEAGSISATIDLFKLIGGDVIIEDVGMADGSINVIYLEDGRANYDIAKTDGSDTADEPEAEEEPFRMQLSHYYLKNINIVYDDRDGDMEAVIKGLNHEGSGDFTLSEFLLKTTTGIKSLSFEMEGEEYLKNVTVRSEINLLMNMDEFKFTIDTSWLQLNAMRMYANGWLAMPGDSIAMDLSMATTNNEFKQLLSLVPAAYTSDFDQVKASGILGLSAWMKGVYYSDDEVFILPAFKCRMNVSDGSFAYPGLKGNVSNIGIDLLAEYPGGALDNMVIDLKKFEAQFMGNSIESAINIKNPMNNPKARGFVKADVDLASVPEVMPVEDETMYRGKIAADLQFEGDLATAESGDYENISASGSIEASGLQYNDAEMGPPVRIDHTLLAFDMKKVRLEDFDAKLGRSDIKASGSLSNFFSWYINNDVLHGNLMVTSKLLDLNEWMSEEDEPAEPADTNVEATVDDGSLIPLNIALTARATFGQLIYDNIEMVNASARIKLNNGILDIEKMDAEMLGGKAIVSGTVNGQRSDTIPYLFDISAVNWSVKQVAETFASVDKLAPVLKGTTGRFSTSLKLSGVLDANFDPVLSSVDFYGELKTSGIGFASTTLEQIDKLIGSDKFNPLKLSNVIAKYSFKNGTLRIKPFDVSIGGQKATIEGYTTLEGKINYLIDTKVKTEALGKAGTSLANEVNSFLQSNGLTQASIPDEIPVKIAITGETTNPKVKPVFVGLSGEQTVKEQVIDMAKKELEKQKEELKKQANEEAEKILAEARKQADALLAEAQKQADVIKRQGRSAAKAIRDEAAKQADGLVKQAGNPLEKIAAETAAKKLREEADKRAKQVENEANKKADELMNTARKQADKILKDAEKRSKEVIEEI